ncbi:MAG: Ltp family lipoprotein [Synergistaceae bacterium]|nr:Ltp family lipoprotein [Synergistaceae bacterium]
MRKTIMSVVIFLVFCTAVFGETMGERNALRAAKQYLELTGFSYSGLIRQLELAEFSHEEAVYAADNCGADWNEQAEKTAKTYLELAGFSRKGLIKQLTLAGFTSEQAEYGAQKAGY